MTPEARFEFEERIVQGQEPSPPGGHPDNSDRLTKSGRLNLEQVKDAIEESAKDV